MNTLLFIAFVAAFVGLVTSAVVLVKLIKDYKA